MKAIILAAGMGTRLRPITSSIPKCLVPVNSKPILEHQFEALLLAGIRDVILVVGHLAELLFYKYGTSYGSLNIDYVENPRYDRTNNIYSLWLARQHLNSQVLLLEGDLVFDPWPVTRARIRTRILFLMDDEAKTRADALDECREDFAKLRAKIGRKRGQP